MSRNRQHPCGKRRFHDVEEAKRALRMAKGYARRQMEEFGETNRHENRYYACPRCHGVHLTSAEAHNPSQELFKRKDFAHAA